MANRELEDLLESDDEFPNFYEEVEDLPAYQNDNRFETINFPWIDNNKYLEQCLPNDDASSQSSNTCQTISQREVEEYLLKDDVPSQSSSKYNNVHQPQTEIKQSKDKKLIKKGILNKQDILCIRCVATVFTDTTLLWFINFLMHKDMLSDYKFLQSCLVEDLVNEDLSYEKETCIELRTHHFQIIVK